MKKKVNKITTYPYSKNWYIFETAILHLILTYVHNKIDHYIIFKLLQTHSTIFLKIVLFFKSFYFFNCICNKHLVYNF